MSDHPATNLTLAGQTVVVTGSSSGIGRAIALELAAAGADVLVHGSSNRDGAATTAEQVEQLGRSAHVVMADFSSDDGCDSLVERAYAWRPRIDVWVNNAGVDVLTGEAADWSFEEKLDALWRVDVTATLRLCRAVGRRMLAVDRPGGVLVNMGWDHADHGMAGDSGELFAATKGAVMAATRSLAKSLAPHVRVNCVAPGWIKTAWGDQASAAWQQRAVAESLLSRWGTPEDVARTVKFLASPESAFITGHVLPVNGGFRGDADDTTPQGDWNE